MRSAALPVLDPEIVGDYRIQNGQGHCAGQQARVVELADIEAIAQCLFRLLAEAQPCELAYHVAAGLAGPHAVALNLGYDAGFWCPKSVDIVSDGLFAAPAHRV